MTTPSTEGELHARMPKLASYQLWLFISGWVAMWGIPAAFAFPTMSFALYPLLGLELGWSLLWVIILLREMRQFQVEFTDQGVVRHGLLRDIVILWPDACVRRKRQLLEVFDGKHVIRINPLIYRDGAELYEFLAARSPGGESGL